MQKKFHQIRAATTTNSITLKTFIMKTISDQKEFDAIIAGGKPVVFDFYADWCGPCRALLPVLEAAGEEYGDQVVIAKVNVDQNPDLATKYGVRSIPSVFLMNGSTVVDHFTGVQSRTEVNKRIDKLIEASAEKSSH